MAGITICQKRLRADIEQINALGRIDGQPGINRISFSDADMAGRRWLMRRMEDAGLKTRMDSLGNVYGRWETGSGPALLVGSHTDTVPMGGPFDGTLGVMAALEAVRAIKEAGEHPRQPIEVVSTADEEGRFGGMLGSQAICGELDKQWVNKAIDESGVTLTSALAQQGLSGDIPAPRINNDIAMFLEMHIEQGPVLEQTAHQIGVISAISGIFNWVVTLKGEANHSGTTPMNYRRDAFCGMADFGAAIPKILEQAGTEETRLTVGRVALSPNFPHSVAGEAVFTINARDPRESVMRNLATACRAEIERVAANHNLSAEIKQHSWLQPAALDDDVAQQLYEMATGAGYRTLRMTSGAGHDAQNFSRHVPTGLIFVPSRKGISHSPDEWTDWEDIYRGAELLANAVMHFSGATIA